MSRTDGPQAAGECALQVAKLNDRVGAFEREDIADRRVGRRVVLPQGDVAGERPPVANLHQLAAFFHRAIPGELPLRLRPGDLGRVPARQRIAVGDVAGDLRRNAQADLAPPHLSKSADALAAIELVGLADLAAANLVQRPRQIAVPLQGVHGEIEMTIN